MVECFAVIGRCAVGVMQRRFLPDKARLRSLAESYQHQGNGAAFSVAQKAQLLGFQLMTCPYGKKLSQPLRLVDQEKVTAVT